MRRIVRLNVTTFDAWELNIWTNDGQKLIGLKGFSYLPREYPDGYMVSKPRDPKDSLERVNEDEIHRLTSSHAADVARSIYMNVLRLQGNSGALARSQLQKTVRLQKSFGGGVLGYWSPNGEIAMIGYHAGDDEVVRLEAK